MDLYSFIQLLRLYARINRLSDLEHPIPESRPPKIMRFGQVEWDGGMGDSGKGRKREVSEVNKVLASLYARYPCSDSGRSLEFV